MGDITSITFSIGDDTFQIVKGQLLVWKGLPDHDPDLDISMEDMQRLISASGFLRKEP